ncbi:MAG TPA: hypothetical protein VKE40_23895 [Gemmataceae bacterium]|nr:hypothetical protein [Gemmataceae bacterium]
MDERNDYAEPGSNPLPVDHKVDWTVVGLIGLAVGILIVIMFWLCSLWLPG